MGVGDDDLLLNSTLTLKDLEDHDGFISEAEFDLIYHNSIFSTDCRFFGLYHGSKISLQQFGALGFLMMNSSSLHMALYSFQSFQAVLGESVVINIKDDGRTTRINFELYGGKKTGQHRIESFFSIVKEACLELTGKELKITKIGYQYAPTFPVAEYSKCLGIIPIQTNENYLEFSSFFMKLPIINSIPELNPIFENFLQFKIQEDESNSFARKVKRELIRRVEKGSSRSVEDLSRYFGLSDRNFQLKLEQENSSYRQIHDKVQADFSERSLKNGSEISEIAFALGFSEPSAFQRAYKRWTGKTPGQTKAKT
jgi:AraC-like DNA-binding protein